jgi:LacI family repressor for deo operon, udp, cdd, tsx, nupC, and nupG
MRRTVTIRDVSHRAGVSLSTVSRVLNDHSTVNPAMRERVLQAVQDLGYRPNLAARTLKTSRSHLIVFVIPEISNPYYTETYRGIHSVAAERGYVTLIHEATDVHAAIQSILNRGADGVVIDAFYTQESKDKLIQAGIPFVQTNAPASFSIEESSVRIDVYGAMIEVLDYLREMGHERVGVIDGNTITSAMDERERAFRAYAETHGIEDPNRFIVSTVRNQDKYGGGFSGIRELVARDVGITAIVALNDLVAIGAVAGARTVGLSVPNDLSVVGFDNTDIAKYANPPLTTVAIPTLKQGQIAAKMLFDMLDDPNEHRYSAQLHTELIIRESVRRGFS